MEKNNELNKESVNSLATVVPQVFYDVIARVIPGSIIIMLLCLSYYGTIDTSLEKISGLFEDNILRSSFILFVSALTISYVLSVILWRQIDFIMPVLNWLTKDQYYSTTHRYESYLYDYIKTKDCSAGSRITKLRAEKHMTEVLLIGFIYCFIINTVKIVYSQDEITARIILSVIFVICFISISKARNYYWNRSTVALNNYFILCGKPNVTDINEISKELDLLKKNLKDLTDN